MHRPSEHGEGRHQQRAPGKLPTQKRKKRVRPSKTVAGVAGPVGLTLAKSVIDLVTAIIKARSEGVVRGRAPHHLTRARGRRWHWRSGDRPSYLSGPKRTEPRSAAERLLALETKLLLFWVGQKRDSVLSRSPAPRFDCSGLHERNLVVATLWPSPTSGTLDGRRFRAEKGADEPHVSAGARSVGPMEGSNQAGARHRPLDR